MAEVTIIIPAYNAGRHINECLNSLYAQTLKNLEILVINDGSIDDTESNIISFKKNHPDFNLSLNTVDNGGAAKARNIGIRKASSRYIGFIDADDTVDKKMFEEMLLSAIKYDADIVSCDFYWQYEKKKKRETLGMIDNQNDLFFGAWVAPWNKLYRKSVLIDHSVYFTEGFTYEDTAFYLKCIPFCKSTVHLSKPFVNWRQSSASTMGKSQDERIPQIFPVLEDAIDFYKQNDAFFQYKKELEYFCTKLLWGSSMYRICQVRNKNDRRGYIDMTFSWLDRFFPDWKHNCYLKKELRGIYIWSLTSFTAELYSRLIYLLRYYGRNKM